MTENTKRVWIEWSANDTIVVWIRCDDVEFNHTASEDVAYRWFRESEKNKIWWVEWANPYDDRIIHLYYLRAYLDE